MCWVRFFAVAYSSFDGEFEVRMFTAGGADGGKCLSLGEIEFL